MKTKFAALAAVAAANPEGFTVGAETLQPVKHGFAVAVAATQNSFGPEGLARVIEYQSTHKECQAFGGWRDEKSGLFFYDATIIVTDINAAYDLARTNKQLAFFDLDNMNEIRIDL